MRPTMESSEHTGPDWHRRLRSVDRVVGWVIPLIVIAALIYSAGEDRPSILIGGLLVAIGGLAWSVSVSLLTKAPLFEFRRPSWVIFVALFFIGLYLASQI